MISEMLKDNRKFDIEDNIRILSDVLDVNAKYILPKMLNILENRGKTNLKYYSDLKNWDYVMSKESTAATIYSVLELSLSENFILNNSDVQSARGLSTVLFYWDFINDLIERISNGETIELKQCGFYAGTRDCERYFIKVFENLDQYLEEYKNSDGSVKSWGEVHYNYYPSIFFDKIPVLNEFFSRRVSTGGNKNTVKVSKSKYNHHHGALVSNHAASLKYICDLSNMEQPYLTVDTGVSGNILSKYYDNFLKVNEENRMVRIAHHDFSSDHFNRTIYLTPSNKGVFSSRNQ
jgi:penicillin amidase